MKKKIAVLMGVVICLSFSACSVKQEVVQEQSSLVQSESSEEEELNENEVSEEEVNNAADEETVFGVGDVAPLKDWEISVTDFTMVDSIAWEYGSFKPDEGNKFAQVFVTVTNNGKQSDSFLPSFGFGDDVCSKIIYGDGYEFSASNLLGYSNDLHDSTINPLSSKTGEIAFQIPQSVSDGTEGLILQFISGNDKVEFKVR